MNKKYNLNQIINDEISNNDNNNFIIEGNDFLQSNELTKEINNNYRIALLLKEKLEKENTINLLQKNIKNLNKSIQEISKENEIHKNRINELNLIIKKMKIKEVKNDSELNELKKLNKNLSEELDNIKLKNKEALNEINKKDQLLEKLNKNKEERENKLIKSQVLISNAVKDYELYIKLNNKYEKENKNLKETIKNYQEKETKLENKIKELNKIISEYENNIIKLKSDLLQSQKNLIFISSDKQELLLTNEKLKNDLNNLNIENRRNIILKRNIEEENDLMKNQKMRDESDINILRANNEMLLNNKKKLDRNLQKFREENKQCESVINQLKEEIDILNIQKNELLLQNNLNNNINTYELNSYNN